MIWYNGITTNRRGGELLSVGEITETGKHHPLIQHTTEHALAGMMVPSCIRNPPLSFTFPFPLKNQMTLIIAMKIFDDDSALLILCTYPVSLELSRAASDDDDVSEYSFTLFWSLIAINSYILNGI